MGGNFIGLRRREGVVGVGYACVFLDVCTKLHLLGLSR